MEKNELIALVKKILAANCTEKELDEMVSLFVENVPDPNATKYLYAKEYEGLSPDQIVEKAMAYRPFQL